MKRKLLAFAAAGALLLTMTACSSTPSASEVPSESASASVTAATEEPTEAVSASVAAATEEPTEAVSEASSADASPLVLSADGELAGLTYKYSPAWETVPVADMPEGYETAGYGVVSTDPVIAASIVLQVQPSAIYDASGQTGEDIAETFATMYGVVDAKASATTFDGVDCWMFTGTGAPIEGNDQEVTATGYIVPAGGSYYIIMTIGGADSATQDLLKEFTDSIKIPA